MRNLKYGHTGADVAGLQRLLSTHGHAVDDDGIFGAKTETALTAFQATAGLVIDGIFGAKTRAALAGQDIRRMLREADLTAAAELLGVDVASIKAVHHVESRGSGFLADGRVKILFERHVFYRELAKKYTDAVAAHWAKAAPHVCNRRPGGYLGGVAEYPRFARAAEIDTECAQRATSWGLYQIMGFNYRAAGFGSAADMVDAMHQSEAAQLMAFARFIRADKTLHGYLKNHDWAKFARRYNGPEYARNAYDTKLAAAYARFAG